MAPARLCAYRVLRRVFEQGAYAEKALAGEAGELDGRDRALAMRLAYGAVQRRGTTDHLIGALAALDTDFTAGALVITSRASTEIVQKAAAVGIGATWLTATRGTELGTLTIGAWTARPKTGTADVDPYSRASIARSGELPIGTGDGIAFSATADDRKHPLDGRCDVVVSGVPPAARTRSATVEENVELAKSPSLEPSPVKSNRSTAMPLAANAVAMCLAANPSLPQVKQCANSA